MEILWKYGKTDIADCYFVRKKVFVEEQGFDSELEFDDIDAIAHHLLLCEDGKPMATARLFSENGEYHCGRICILQEYRKRGIGLIIMKELEKKAAELGALRLMLSAQVRVSGFYEKAGYIPYGEEYPDEFCPHIAMSKNLQAK